MSGPSSRIALAIRRNITKQAAEVKLRSAIVTAMTGGLATVRKVGSANAEGDYARLIPGIPKVGNRVALAKMGGSELVLGVISRVSETLLDLGAPLVGQSYPGRATAATPETASTTSTSVYATALTFTWSDLPDGTYDIAIVGSLLAAHSTSAGVNCGVDCAGTVQANAGVSCPAGANPFTRIQRSGTFAGVVVAGGVTLKVVFKAASAGTVTVVNPDLFVVAVRKG